MSTHTASVVGTLTYSSPLGDSPLSLAAGITGVTDFDPHSRTLAPGALNVTVTPAASPANGLLLKTNKPMRFRINSGTEDIRCDRIALLIGCSITQVELFNDQQTPARQLQVDVVFITGATLI